MTHHEINPQFAIHNHVEIVHVLNELAKHHVLINLTTHEGDALVTAVLYVSGDRHFVCIDVSSDDAVNQRIADSKLVSFETQSEIKVRWHSTHLQLVTARDGLAFSLHVPSEIERIQRREYFRLYTPQGSGVLKCKVPLDEENVIEVALVDMSAGGIGVTYRGASNDVFVQGAILEGCSIDFPEIGRVPMSLRVCGIWQSTSTKSGEHIHRIGMEFVGLSRGVTNVIQRYMIHLEAEKITPT
ncbi:MAG: flagellar brake protein [Gammaproteobacteria bacterium]|nr:flagellar brake protein [Gammaproteobacteria bacterium]MBU1623858.1 flagellar brake protein [Gammaproteobacteria bacterium]MBU1982075.1 flagellar brake protein [Gammaproteobacteria bacterium]